MDQQGSAPDRTAGSPHAYRLAACLLAGLAVVIGGLWPAPLRAQVGPTADAPCRLCHADSQESFALPSGESVPVQVDLAGFDHSAHGRAAAIPVTCTSCHTGQGRYRYPHAPNPAQTLAEFTVEVAAACQGCHYPHLPFHDAEALGAAAPTCVDCHGSHTIAPVAEIHTVMPAACLACHTDQTADWAAGFVAPRPGLGIGADGYAGSMRCNGCHDPIYVTWHATLHAQFVRDPAQDPAAILGDFDQADPDRTFGREAVAYTLGNRWRQLYLAWSDATTPLTVTETVSATAMITPTGTVSPAADTKLVLLPAQWAVATETWEPLQGDGSPGEAWLASCGGCHVTGLDPATGGFTEFGIGCESCHGPGAAHAADPENVKPYAQADDQVCGACHSRGMSPQGFAYPVTYRPGDTLADHFTFTQDATALWPDGSARRNRQQLLDWQLGSTMAEAEGISCTTCHRVHDPGAAPGQLDQPLNELCVSCHDEQRALVRHTPFHEAALRQRSFLCTDCHMPALASSGAAPFDLHNHSFLQPNPQGSLDHGGPAAMPNACNQCHTDQAETAQWAAQTIAFAAAYATPSSAAFFGPGPTPTSPPPPTPVSSVGVPSDFDPTRPNWPLRLSLLAVVGLAAAAIVGLIIYSFAVWRTRRASHA